MYDRRSKSVRRRRCLWRPARVNIGNVKCPPPDESKEQQYLPRHMTSKHGSRCHIRNLLRKNHDSMTALTRRRCCLHVPIDGTLYPWSELGVAAVCRGEEPESLSPVCTHIVSCLHKHLVLKITHARALVSTGSCMVNAGVGWRLGGSPCTYTIELCRRLPVRARDARLELPRTFSQPAMANCDGDKRARRYPLFAPVVSRCCVPQRNIASPQKTGASTRQTTNIDADLRSVVGTPRVSTIRERSQG